MRLMFPDKFLIQSDNGLWINGAEKATFDNGGDYFPPRFFNDPEVLEKYQLVELVEEPQPDTRYFNSYSDLENPGKWIAIPVKDETLKPQLKQQAAAMRWGREISGVDFIGLRIATDESSQRKIAELRRQAELGEVKLPFLFKSTSGWVPMDLAAIQAVYTAIATHIQECYVWEKATSDKIDAGEITTFEQLNTSAP